jgi:ubiquitin C-terminal hydrolase
MLLICFCSRQDKAPLYDLFAVSNHFGGLGGGHYTAYAQLPAASAAEVDTAASRGGGMANGFAAHPA